VEPIGERTGLSIEGLSRALIVTAVVACIGPLTAAKIGSRFGVLPPIVIGQALMIALSLFMVVTREPVLFGAALSLRVVDVLFLVPRYNGLFARIDPIGRVVAASQGAQGIAYGVGPLIGGQLIALQDRSFVILGAVAAAAAAISLAMTMVLVPRGIRSSEVREAQI
jgi:predicted MFS family arabinose efflux permease